VNLDGVPAELRQLDRWVAWRLEQRDGKPTKVPYRTDGQGRASSTDPTTWSTFEQALSTASAADGFGLALGDGLVGIDLDGVLGADGAIASSFQLPDVAAWIATLNSYTERSPSGTGLHIIGQGEIPTWSGNRTGPVEVYGAGRYFTVNGDVFEGLATVRNLRELERFLEAAGLRKTEPSSNGRSPTVVVDLDDRELLERASGARNGAEFDRLWSGDTSGFASASEADLALCSRLAFWTGRSAGRIDRLFRSSGLYREKWERADYHERTLETAIAGCAEVYEPRPTLSTPLSGCRSLSRPTSAAGSANSYLRSDLGNAELFADRHAEGLRHVKERRLWLVWESGRWRPDATGAAERATKALARERLRAAADVEGEDERKDAVKWAMMSQSDSRIRAALSLATTETAIVLRLEDLDTDPFLLACANGTLDLRTGELRPPDPVDLITLGNDVPYQPDAVCPRWDRFLEEVFDGDEPLIVFLQRLAGYSLTGDTREQIVAVLHGSGNNGKDTLIKPLVRVVGEQAETSPMDTFTRVRDRSVRNDLARLHRARLVIASESAEGRRLDEPTIKLVSGGGRVAARFLYGEFFEFTPQFKVWLITNHRPRVEGDDDAIWRRLRLIPFNVSFLGREDKELDAKLEQELPGILAWAVRGCLEWQAQGLGLPPAVEQATREYRADEDVLGTFIAERCILEGEIEPAVLREVYDAFCTEIGERPVSASVLGKRLARRGIKRKDGPQHGFYIGISLK
jgi:putative DNA primase/helicase